jgi:exopolyphosphatase / guanosine-5'-triphosphate,3'-diphosphate pyrophosphatase
MRSKAILCYKNAMRLAAIDVGSNSILLLVADVVHGAIQAPLDEQIHITRLGERLSSDQQLPEEAMARSLDAIAEYQQRAHALGAEQTLPVATAAVREAANGAEFARRVQARTGMALQVISAQREAELGLQGVRSDPALADSDLLVLDIGGGSTELVAGGPKGVIGTTSIAIGSVRLRAQAADASATADVERLIRAATAQVAAPLQRLSRLAPAGQMVGIGGTITALGTTDLGLDEQHHTQVDGHELRSARVRELAELVADTPPDRRDSIVGLPKGRQDTIVPGAAILLAAMQALQRPSLRVSVRGLRYGVLLAASRQG